MVRPVDPRTSELRKNFDKPFEHLRVAFEQAYATGDAAALANLFTEDAELLPPGEPPIVGRAILQSRYAAQFARVKSQFSFNITRTWVNGDFGALEGFYDRRDVDAGGAVYNYSGKTVMLLRRFGNDWKIARDIWNGNVAEDVALVLPASVGLDAIIALVEQRLGGAVRLLEVMTQTREAQAAEWDSVRPTLESIATVGLPANALWFMLPDGTYYTLESGKQAQTLADRPYFADLAGGKVVRGALVVSKSTGKRSVVVAAPIVRSGHVVGALGASLSLEFLSDELNRQLRLPKTNQFYALDSQGQIAMHQDPSLILEFAAELGDEQLRSAITEMLAKDEGVVHYTFRGVSKTVLYKRSKALGWVFALPYLEGQPAK